MNYRSSLRVAVAPDLGESLDILLPCLTAGEREQAERLPSDRRRRQYVIGRLAARKAIRQLPERRIQVSSIEISGDIEHEPRVLVDGAAHRVSASISHSSRLGIACAWLEEAMNPASAGIDLEHLRPNEVAESTYAFSRRERRLLLRSLEGVEVAALAAWTVKEAVWKALLAGQEIGPDAIELVSQSLAKGQAVVRVKGQLSKRLGESRLQVRLGRIEGPDGPYVFTVAQVVPSRSSHPMTDDCTKWNVEQTGHPFPWSETMS